MVTSRGIFNLFSRGFDHQFTHQCQYRQLMSGDCGVFLINYFPIQNDAPRFMSCLRKPVSRSHVPSPDLDKLSRETVFSKRELKRIFERYCSVCQDDGMLRKLEFCYIPELTLCPMSAYFFDVQCGNSVKLALEVVDNEEADLLDCFVDFNGFIRILHILSQKTALSEKMECEVQKLFHCDFDLAILFHPRRFFIAF